MRDCLLLFLLGVSGVQMTVAQTEFFHEIELEKSVWENKKWQLDAAASWKHIYDRVGWRRIGLDAYIGRLAGNWKMTAGLSTFYTFDREIENFGELRPWLSLGYHFVIFKKVIIRQRIRSEWRFFLNGDAEYHRFRYAINLGFALWESERWSQVVGFESYFLDAPALFERFPSERDIRLLFGYKVSDTQKLDMGLKFETFLDAEQTIAGEALLFILGFSF